MTKRLGTSGFPVTRKGQREKEPNDATTSAIATISDMKRERRRHRSDAGVRREHSLDTSHLAQQNSSRKRRSSKEKLDVGSSTKPIDRPRSASLVSREGAETSNLAGGDQLLRRKIASLPEKRRSRSNEGNALPSSSRLRDSSIGRYRSSSRYRNKSLGRSRSGSRSRSEDRPLTVQRPKTRAVLEREKSLSKIFYGDEKVKKSDNQQEQKGKWCGTHHRAFTRVSVKDNPRFFPNASFSVLDSSMLDDLDVGTDLSLGFSTLSGHSRKTSSGRDEKTIITENEYDGPKTPITSGNQFSRRKDVYRNQPQKNNGGNDIGGGNKAEELSKCFNMALTNMNQLVL